MGDSERRSVRPKGIGPGLKVGLQFSDVMERYSALPLGDEFEESLAKPTGGTSLRTRVVRGLIAEGTQEEEAQLDGV